MTKRIRLTHQVGPVGWVKKSYVIIYTDNMKITLLFTIEESSTHSNWNQTNFPNRVQNNYTSTISLFFTF